VFSSSAQPVASSPSSDLIGSVWPNQRQCKSSVSTSVLLVFSNYINPALTRWCISCVLTGSKFLLLSLSRVYYENEARRACHEYGLEILSSQSLKMLLFSGSCLRVIRQKFASVPAEPAAYDCTPKMEAAVSHLSPRFLYFDRMNQACSQTMNIDGGFQFGCIYIRLYVYIMLCYTQSVIHIMCT